jgi:hypothetical protein
LKGWRFSSISYFCSHTFVSFSLSLCQSFKTYTEPILQRVEAAERRAVEQKAFEEKNNVEQLRVSHFHPGQWRKHRLLEYWSCCQTPVTGSKDAVGCQKREEKGRFGLSINPSSDSSGSGSGGVDGASTPTSWANTAPSNIGQQMHAPAQLGPIVGARPGSAGGSAAAGVGSGAGLPPSSASNQALARATSVPHLGVKPPL